MDIHRIRRPALRYFRKRRLSLLFSRFEITEDTRVLDLGGTSFFWELCHELRLPTPKVTILNMDPSHREFPLVQADACCIPFRDGVFDLVFCNSLIEHIPSMDQPAVALEIARVGRSFFVQTPSRAFWFEPHFVAPFIHWFPLSVRLALGRITPWALLTRPSEGRYQSMCRMKLLTRRALESLFPDSVILVERHLLWPKSLIALRSSPASH